MTKEIDTISAETMSALVHYPWPGNIRELQNVIERAVILSKGPVLKVSLADLRAKTSDTNGHTNGAATLEEIERRHILSVLEQTNWVFAGPNGAAAKLGIKASNTPISDAKTWYHPPAEILTDQCQPFGTLPIYKHLSMYFIKFCDLFPKLPLKKWPQVRHVDCKHAK